jgi:hypothetical protein
MVKMKLILTLSSVSLPSEPPRPGSSFAIIGPPGNTAPISLQRQSSFRHQAARR